MAQPNDIKEAHGTANGVLKDSMGAYTIRDISDSVPVDNAMCEDLGIGNVRTTGEKQTI